MNDLALAGLPSGVFRGTARTGVVVAATLAWAASCLHEPAPLEAAPAALSSVERANALYPPDERGARVVVLVAIDGVRWQDVFEGVEEERARAAGVAADEIVDAPTLVPNLWWLQRTRGAAVGGTCRSSMRASGPEYVSLPGYLEMLSGSRATGCTSNECAAPPLETLADAFARHADGPGEVAAFASWPRLASGVARQPERVVVSAGRAGTNHPELLRYDEPAFELFERGERAAAEPGYGAYRPDRFTAPLAVRYLRARQPRFLFLSLGDTDEHAHENDYRGYLRALRYADAVVGEIAVALSEMSAGGVSTLLLVTTDHGRDHGFASHGGKHPESGDVWMIAAGDAVRARGCVESEAPHHLADVAMTVFAVAGLAPPDGPAPARRGEVMAELFVPAPREPVLAWAQ